MSCCCWPSRGNTTVSRWQPHGAVLGLGKAAMISHADVEKLRSIRAPGPAVLSLYLPVPLDPAGVRDLAARAVPDLLEEMVQRTLDDNGAVTMIRDAPFSVAAKLRFPVTGRESAAARPAVAQATIDAR